MLDLRPNNLETSSCGRLLYHGKELCELGQSHRVFFALAKVSTVTTTANISKSSSSDDESSNCLRRRDLFLGMVLDRQMFWNMNNLDHLEADGTFPQYIARNRSI